MVEKFKISKFGENFINASGHCRDSDVIMFTQLKKSVFIFWVFQIFKLFIQ